VPAPEEHDEESRARAVRMDEAGLSAQQLVDHLGTSGPNHPQGVYLSRRLASPEAAAALQRRQQLAATSPIPAAHGRGAQGFVGRSLGRGALSVDRPSH
jgi:hypothetical protein